MKTNSGVISLIILVMTLSNFARAEEIAPIDFWRAFRQTSPFPLQDIIASPISASGEMVVLLTEPPARLWSDRENAIKAAFGDKLVAMEVHTWKIGFDGWVKDIVVTLGNMDDAALTRGVRSLAKISYDTDYAASYRTFEPHSWNSFAEPHRHLAPPNLQISAASLNDWLFQSPLLFTNRTAAVDGAATSPRPAAIPLATVFDQPYGGVFYSNSPGLIILVLDRNRSLNEATAQLRQFCLDSDTLLGAVSRENSSKLVLVGRERHSSVTDMPPLRVDTILTLAAAKEDNLAQSYERHTALAGPTLDPALVQFVAPPLPPTEPGDDGDDRYPLVLMVDWAPILLSRELTGTEYGQLLNITDQLLKGWSQGNLVAYGNFPYPVPTAVPNPNGIFARLQTTLGSSFDSLTFNWNTSGFGTWNQFGKYQIFSVLNSGALPISYIPDVSDSDRNDASRAIIRKAEDEYWAFFADQRNPDLNRAAQYAALHVIFSRFPVTAARTEPLIAEPAYDRRWDTLKDEVVLRVRQIATELSPDEFRGPPTPLDTRALAPANPSNWPDPEGRVPWTDTEAVVAYYASHDNELAALATIMVEPRLLASVVTNEQTQLGAEEDVYNQKVDTFNNQLRACRLTNGGPGCRSLGSEQAALMIGKTTLDAHLLAVQKVQRAYRALVADGRRISPLLGYPLGLGPAWRRVQQANEAPPDASVKTPSIVVSTDVLGIMYGGHNLDGRSLRIVDDPQVSTGSFRVDEDGNVLRLNPADMPNSARVGRDFERSRIEYLTGNATTRRQIENRITVGLRSDGAVVKPFQPAVLALDERAPGARRLGADPARRVVGDYVYTMTEPELAHASAIATQTEANLVAGWNGRTYSLVDPGPPPVGVATESPATMLRLIETKAAMAAESGKGASRYIVVSDGSLSMAELDGVRVSGQTRQLVAASGGSGGGLPPDARIGMFFEESPGPGPRSGPTGGGGSNGGGRGPNGAGEPPRDAGGPPRNGGEAEGRRWLLAFPFSARAGRTLSRTDAHWAGATVRTEAVTILQQGRIIVGVMDIPFKQAAEPLHVKLTARFRRPSTDPAPGEALRDFVNQHVTTIKDGTSVGQALKTIRNEFQQEMRGDARLIIQLQQSDLDFFVVDSLPSGDPLG